MSLSMKNSLSHTVWECKYHIVWVPKKRRKIIYGKLKKEIGTILHRLCKYKGVELIEGKGCIDHIHVCLSIPPKYSVCPTPASVMQTMKHINMVKNNLQKANYRNLKNFNPLLHFVEHQMLYTPSLSTQRQLRHPCRKFQLFCLPAP